MLQYQNVNNVQHRTTYNDIKIYNVSVQSILSMCICSTVRTNSNFYSSNYNKSVYKSEPNKKYLIKYDKIRK